VSRGSRSLCRTGSEVRQQFLNGADDDHLRVHRPRSVRAFEHRAAPATRRSQDPVALGLVALWIPMRSCGFFRFSSAVHGGLQKSAFIRGLPTRCDLSTGGAPHASQFAEVGELGPRWSA